MEIAFRKGIKEDAAVIAPLIKQNYNVKTKLDAMEFFEKDLNAGVNYVVAEAGNEIAGFATWKEHDRPYHELAELHAIAVDDSFKGKGLSMQLFSALLAQAKDYYAGHNYSLRKIYVLTHATNERAIKFYEKMGFEKEAVLPKHYYHDVDELVLSRYFY